MNLPISPETLEKWKSEFGFDLINWVPLPWPVTFDFYSGWLEDQRHGGMEYLKTQKDQKKDPKNLLDVADSLLVVGVRYKPHPHPRASSLQVAAYAEGEDYHFWLMDRLKRWSETIQKENPDFRFVIATDSKPLLERDLAKQAGLGWVGKNTCLIHPSIGSFFLIGEVLTNIKVQTVAANIPDFCGTCTRCMDACPTNALVEPRLLDARKCISYWTIEAKEAPPTEIREKIGTLFFGCDICQDVCPWNEKVFRKEPLPPKKSSREDQIEELRYFLTASNRQIEKDWAGSPLLRARPRGLRRNALIVAGNAGYFELKAEVQNWSKDEELGEVANWCLEKWRAQFTQPVRR